LITVLLYARASGFHYKPAVAVNAAGRLYDCYDCGGPAPGAFRSARDFERYATTVAAFICLAVIRIMPRRLSANVSL
jgi:hypothetical protein